MPTFLGSEYDRCEGPPSSPLKTWFPQRFFYLSMLIKPTVGQLNSYVFLRLREEIFSSARY